jgi:hypothetical protein
MKRKIAGLVLAVAVVMPAASMAAQHQVVNRSSWWDAVKHWVVTLMIAPGAGTVPDAGSIIDPNQ